MRILKIHSLPNSRNWIDRDYLMLHACFQILTDFIEKENGDSNCDYEENKEFVDEVRFLYDWWKIRRDEESLDIEFEKDDEMLIRLMKVRTQLWT